MGLHGGPVYGTPPISGAGRGTCWACTGRRSLSSAKFPDTIKNVVCILDDPLPHLFWVEVHLVEVATVWVLVALPHI